MLGVQVGLRLAVDQPLVIMAEQQLRYERNELKLTFTESVRKVLDPPASLDWVLIWS